jgi:hypothetical protein
LTKHTRKKGKDKNRQKQTITNNKWQHMTTTENNKQQQLQQQLQKSTKINKININRTGVWRELERAGKNWQKTTENHRK